MPQLPHLIDAGCSLPIDNVNQLPGKSNEIELQLPLLIKHELGFRVEGARDRDVAHRFHLGQRVEQPLILAVLECLGQNLVICLRGVLINGQRYREFLSHLRLCASGSSVNGFWLRSVLGKGRGASQAEKTNQHQTTNEEVMTSM